ncbi:FAR1-related sequence 7-like protein [Tanacetum coccineum]
MHEWYSWLMATRASRMCFHVRRSEDYVYIGFFQAWSSGKCPGRRQYPMLLDPKMELFKMSIAQVLRDTLSTVFSTHSILLKKTENIGVVTENTWVKEMYRMRKSWVPFYLRGTFFAGIPVEGNIKSYFETFITPQVVLDEFITRYEKAIEHHREAERKEDFNSYNLQPQFSIQKTRIKINIEGAITRYLVQRCGNGDERNTVAFNASNLNVSTQYAECLRFLKRWETKSAKYGNPRDVDSAGGSQDLKALMVWSLREEAHSYIDAGSASLERYKLAFEILQEGRRNCRVKDSNILKFPVVHALKVFQIMNIREIPSRYILHRWTKSAKYGNPRDVDSAGGSQDLKALMVWSLREEAHSYIDAGSASLERYKLAFEILQEGRRNVCWQN